jgi:CheY-like chemotaxis protein/two-component sensor histidine kinase
LLGHELRNPLAAVSSAIQVLELVGTTERRSMKAHEVIARQVQHMRRLLDDLLDVARISRGKLSLDRAPIDLGELARVAVQDHLPVFERLGTSVALDVPAQPVMVLGDRVRLAQILGNLLDNAGKFTPPGGRIEVELQARGEDAVLYVRDSGIGIAPESIPELFDPFVQMEATVDRARAGLGLGLALVKGLTLLHGGSVEAESLGRGRGACFVVRLPRTRAEAVAAEQPAAPTEASLSVLIIEDDRDAGEMTCLLVEELGHQVVLAQDGRRGLELARTQHPDLVLCDIGLPGAMDGYDVARALRADSAFARTMLVALTGFGLTEHVRRAEIAGFDRHVTKPIDQAQLREVLATAAVRSLAAKARTSETLT